MKCPFTLREIVEVDVQYDIWSVTYQSRKFSPILNTIYSYLPHNIGYMWNTMADGVLSWAWDADTKEEELVSLIKGLSPGYIRGELRSVWRKRFPADTVSQEEGE